MVRDNENEADKHLALDAKECERLRVIAEKAKRILDAERPGVHLGSELRNLITSEKQKLNEFYYSVSEENRTAAALEELAAASDRTEDAIWNPDKYLEPGKAAELASRPEAARSEDSRELPEATFREAARHAGREITRRREEAGESAARPVSFEEAVKAELARNATDTRSAEPSRLAVAAPKKEESGAKTDFDAAVKELLALRENPSREKTDDNFRQASQNVTRRRLSRGLGR